MTFPSKSGAFYEDSVTVLISLPIIWVFIGIRIYVRGVLTKQPGWDDFTAIIAAVSFASDFRGPKSGTDHQPSVSTRCSAYAFY
jgi:hypothetical protein